MADETAPASAPRPAPEPRPAPHPAPRPHVDCTRAYEHLKTLLESNDELFRNFGIAIYVHLLGCTLPDNLKK